MLPPLHRRDFNILRLCSFLLKWQPSLSGCKLGSLVSTLPVSTVESCSRCLISCSLSLQPAVSPCALDWVQITFQATFLTLCQTRCDGASYLATPSFRLPDDREIIRTYSFQHVRLVTSNSHNQNPAISIQKAEGRNIISERRDN